MKKLLKALREVQAIEDSPTWLEADDGIDHTDSPTWKSELGNLKMSTLLNVAEIVFVLLWIFLITRPNPLYICIHFDTNSHVVS